MIGQTLAHYKILEKIGSGGMGEVYRARDTKLGRDVAIKVLPEEFARDKERLDRFEREARLLAQLNHANVATLHGLEEHDGQQFLVMELVEGETLAERIARSPLPVDEANALFIQIAEGLEAAHEKGIIHRDLKPANITIGPDGKPKILDFGLAKAFVREDGGVPRSSQLPTLTKGTALGVIMGTPSYMSPEQARGITVDKRTDIWAFGCCLYEALTGRVAFQRETVSDTIVAVLEREPDWQLLPDTTPRDLRKLLVRCLVKDRRRRLHDIADARVELDHPLSERAEIGPARSRSPERVAWILSVGLAVAVVALGVAYLDRAPPEILMVHFAFESEGDLAPIVSPDGRHVAFVGSEGAGPAEIVVRSLDSPDIRALAGTRGARYLFWSPDSRFIAFTADGKLKTIQAAGGPVQSLCDSGEGRGGTWSATGDIVFQPTNRAPLYRVSALGGEPTLVTELDASLKENSHRWPHFLPDGRHFLYTARAATSAETGVYVASLDSNESTRLLTAQSNAAYTPQGYLLFVRDGSLMGQRFDADRLALDQSVTPLIENVLHAPESAYAHFSVSSDGSVLAYGSGDLDYQLEWFDRAGRSLGDLGPSGGYTQVRISPDGGRAAVAQPDARTGNRDIWLLDLPRGIPTRYTSEPSQAFYPVWSPDGRALAFASDRNGSADIYVKTMTGASSETPRLVSSATTYPHDWTRDGRLVFRRVEGSQFDLWMLSGDGDNSATSLGETDFEEDHARFSPDGRWLSFTSDELGNEEVYVRSIATDALQGPRITRVSADGGSEARWSEDGRELFYLDREHRLMSVELELEPSFKASTPEPLFQSCAKVHSEGRQSYDVSPDGDRFLFICPSTETPAAQIHVVINGLDKLSSGAVAASAPP